MCWCVTATSRRVDNSTTNVYNYWWVIWISSKWKGTLIQDIHKHTDTTVIRDFKLIVPFHCQIVSNAWIGLSHWPFPLFIIHLLVIVQSALFKLLRSCLFFRFRFVRTSIISNQLISLLPFSQLVLLFIF